MQSDQNLDLADILILEYAALGSPAPGLKEFVTGLLSYTKAPLPTLKQAEAQQRIQQLMVRGFLNSRNQCASDWLYDVVAQAKLSGRSEARCLKSRHRFLPDDPLTAMTAVWAGESHLHKLLSKIRYPASLNALAPQFLDHAFANILPARLDRLEAPGTLLPYLEKFPSPSEYGEILLRACHWAQSGPQSVNQGADTVFAASLTLSGQDSPALKLYQKGHSIYPSGLFQIFYALCALRQGKPLEWFRFSHISDLRLWLKWLEGTRQGTSAPRPEHWHSLKGQVGLLLVGGAALWDEDHELFAEVRPALLEARDKAAAAGWHYLAQLFAELGENKPGPLRDFLPSTPGWKRQLDRLFKLSQPKDDADERLIWRIKLSDREWLAEPYMQKRNKKGWSPKTRWKTKSWPCTPAKGNSPKACWKARTLPPAWTPRPCSG